MVRNLARFLVTMMGRGDGDWSRSYLSTAHDRCLRCDEPIAEAPLYKQFRVCPFCRFHYSITARERLSLLTDTRPRANEYYRALISLDPIQFGRKASYRSKLSRDQARTGLSDAALVCRCAIGGTRIVLLVLDFGFLGGSMGSVVGEKIALAFELALRKKIPLVIVVSGGGVRMQEGVLSLMQMAKTVSAARRMQEQGLPLIAVLASPTTGQAYASFANLADVILAEPGSLIGLAPMRTLREATKDQPLPDDAHTAEFHLRMGLLDAVVDREELRDALSSLLDTITPQDMQPLRRKDLQRVTIEKLPGAKAAVADDTSTAWRSVELARHSDRPSARALLPRIAFNFVELRGDRLHGDDRSVIGGVGVMHGQRVMLIGHDRRLPAAEAHRYGQTMPQGFRKAQRLMKLAAKFGMPVITLIDTPGAYVGLEAEEFGVGNALAQTMATMTDLPVPVVSVVVGQATSEGALALSVANRVLMLEYAIYTPISPERASERLYRHADMAREMADALKLTAADCLELGIIDGIVPEPEGGAHTNVDATAYAVQRAILWELAELRGNSAEKLVRDRARKFRRMGEHTTHFKEAVKQEWSMLQRVLRGRPTSDAARAAVDEADDEPPRLRSDSSRTSRQAPTVSAGDPDGAAPPEPPPAPTRPRGWLRRSSTQ